MCVCVYASITVHLKRRNQFAHINNEIVCSMKLRLHLLSPSLSLSRSITLSLPVSFPFNPQRQSNVRNEKSALVWRLAKEAAGEGGGMVWTGGSWGCAGL